MFSSGAIIQKTNELLPQRAKSQPQMDEDDLSADEGQDVPQEVVIMQEAASFDKLTIWGHEAVPSESEDPYIKGVQEWIQCASSVSPLLNYGDGDAQLTFSDALLRHLEMIQVGCNFWL